MLDLQLYRNSSNNISFNIFRKETSTDRYITQNSFHHASHKQAAFNSMIYRLINIPLSKEDYKIELNRIYNIADINGFHKKLIEKLVSKHKQKLIYKNVTSLSPLENNRKKIACTYDNLIFPSLHKCFSKFNVNLVPNSKTKLQNLLYSTKDKINFLQKPGVYSVRCNATNCNALYIGQTKRELMIRAKEHIRYVKKNEPHKSGIVEHVLDKKHSIDLTCFNLLECEQQYKRLNVLESMHIHLNAECNVNRDLGPNYSPLFSLLCDNS